MKTIVLLPWILIAMSACNGDDPNSCEAAAESCDDLGGVCREVLECGLACEAGESEVDASCGSGICCVPEERLCSGGHGECYDGACPDGLERTDRICTSGGCVCCIDPDEGC